MSSPYVYNNPAFVDPSIDTCSSSAYSGSAYPAVAGYPVANPLVDAYPALVPLNIRRRRGRRTNRCPDVPVAAPHPYVALPNDIPLPVLPKEERPCKPCKPRSCSQSGSRSGSRSSSSSSSSSSLCVESTRAAIARHVTGQSLAYVHTYAATNGIKIHHAWISGDIFPRIGYNPNRLNIHAETNNPHHTSKLADALARSDTVKVIHAFWG